MVLLPSSTSWLGSLTTPSLDCPNVILCNTSSAFFVILIHVLVSSIEKKENHNWTGPSIVRGGKWGKIPGKLYRISTPGIYLFILGIHTTL